MTAATGETLMTIYNLLFTAYGPQNWWPAETQFEMMIGAILTQNTNWNNVEKAIQNLKKRNLLSIEAPVSQGYRSGNCRQHGSLRGWEDPVRSRYLYPSDSVTA
jgi:hypothetical protein